LIARTHKGLKLIIDIVPTTLHEKRRKNNPKGVKDFGADDVTVAYKEIITSIIFQIYFEVPEPKPLNAENHPLSDGMFTEVQPNGLGMVLR
jgi:hypothetical protein